MTLIGPPAGLGWTPSSLGLSLVAVNATPDLSPVRQPSAGERLRSWRSRHGLSQLELSLVTGVSTRHISCIETGRARPSRSMILRLASHLEIPLREQNQILLAAGYAPAYQRTPLDQPALHAAREAIERLLCAHEPFPALVFTTSWWLVSANRPLWWLLDGLPDHVLEPPINVMRISLHPEGLITRVRNPGAWHRHLYGRLWRQANAIRDPDLFELLDEINTYPAPELSVDEPRDRDSLFAMLQFHHHGHHLDFISTLTAFGTPLDLTPAELIIESLYPADTRTSRVISRIMSSAYRGLSQRRDKPARSQEWRVKPGSLKIF
jgi:transcriptional regulator with XRE-family HTH domain